MPELHDLVIIGAGPAGLAAALEAAQAGVKPCVLDGSPAPGGQYFKHHPEAQIPIGGSRYTLSQLLERLDSLGARLHSNRTVWGLTLDNDTGLYSIHFEYAEERHTACLAKRVILASGAYERVIPFSGWTLPGVMTCGAATLLSQSPAVIHGARVVVYGTGPLLWPAACGLAQAGADVIAMVECTPFPWRAWKGLLTLRGQQRRIAEIWAYLQILRRKRIPVWWNSRVTAAKGEHTLESVVIRNDGQNRTKEIEADFLLVAHGLTPASQLALSAGADTEVIGAQNQAAIWRDENLQTSLPGVFAAGDGVQVHGVDAAVLEGQLAANAALRQSGYENAAHRILTLKRQLAHQQRFGRWLTSTFPVPEDCLVGLSDDVLLCRCEEVTVGQVREIAVSGVYSADMLKSITRIGMGRCQGRFCSQNLAAVLAAGQGEFDAQKMLLKPRMPVFPVAIQTLLEDEVQHES